MGTKRQPTRSGNSGSSQTQNHGSKPRRHRQGATPPVGQGTARTQRAPSPQRRGGPVGLTKQGLLAAARLIASGATLEEAWAGSQAPLTSRRRAASRPPGGEKIQARLSPKRRRRSHESSAAASPAPAEPAPSAAASSDASERSPHERRQWRARQQQQAVELVASGLKQVDVAKTLSVHEKTVSRWIIAARRAGTLPLPPAKTPTAHQANSVVASAGGGRDAAADACADADADAAESGQAPSPASTASSTSSLYAPKDPGQGLADYERDAILALKRRHASYGPAQIRAQLKRFKGWRLSIKAIARVLRDNGYELVHHRGRPQGPEPIRFEAPRRNALWQMDFTELRIAGEKLYLLVAQDDFSRFIVGHAVAPSPSSRVASDLLERAIARHGKPEAVRTDRGGAFVAATSETDFARVLELMLIDHIVGRAYHPQGGGKVESFIGTLRRELWDVEHFESREHAKQRIAEFITHFNEQRAHMGIDGLTPADRYFGRADRVLELVNAVSRKRQSAAAAALGRADVFEETAAPGSSSPLEVLRLVMVGGAMELRFCGARVRLGTVES